MMASSLSILVKRDTVDAGAAPAAASPCRAAEEK